MSIEQTFFVKSQNGKYLIDGDIAPNLELISGKTYEFNLSDPSLSSHPLEFKLNGNSWDDRVQYSGTLGIDQTVTLKVPSISDGIVSYHCSNHSGMGNNLSITWNYITGTVGDDTLDGGAGDDILDGGAGDDRLNGGDGNDTLDSGTGDDTILGGLGNDRIDGGVGNDRIGFWDVNYTQGIQVDLSAGTTLDQFGSVDTLLNIENANGTDFDDSLLGDSSDNGLDGNAGNDLLRGYGGMDSLWGREGDDKIYGGNDRDFLIGFAGNDFIDGESGNDVLRYDLDAKYGGILGVEVNLAQQTAIDGFGDADTVKNIYEVRGTQYDDTMLGDFEANKLLGADGSDELDGNNGNDIIYGGEGNDSLTAGDGDDQLFGEAGDDKFHDDWGGNDTFDGGSGIDSLFFPTKKSGITVNVDEGTVASHFSPPSWSPTPEQDELDTIVSIEKFGGTNFEDVFYGSAENETFWGFDGNDILNAGAGDDRLYGGDGDDIINDGRGTDFVDGGAGIDTLQRNLSDDYQDYAFTPIFDLDLGKLYSEEYPDDFDTLISIENLQVEGNFHHTLVGNAANNSLIAGPGNDTLIGGAGNDTLTGGSGSDIFQFHDVFEHDTITDYDSDEDILEFYASDGSALNISDLIETMNTNGNRVLSTADGLSSVTLEGTAGITPVSGALSVVNSGTSTAPVLDFYLDSSKDPGGAGVTSIDVVLKFDSTHASFTSFSFDSGFLGAANEASAADGTITFGAIALTPVSIDQPLFSMTMKDLDSTNDFAVTVSNLNVDGSDLEGSVLVVGSPPNHTITTSVVTRDGSKIADVDVVMSDGTNSFSYTSAADGSVSGSLTSGSASTVTGSLAYSNSTKAVSSQDALDALKLSVGMTTAAGTTTAFDYIAADFNQDGKVTSSDALEILKYAVGLPTTKQAEWVFVDTNGDYSGVSKSNTSYTEGVSIDDLTSDMTVGLTGILIGDVNDSYSGLIA